MQISLNFITSCYNIKTRGLGTEMCVAIVCVYSIILILKEITMV